ncbi:MAG: hypothetical protein WAP03_11710 [Methylorubrum rhodinum]|uniref:hypothetical protein n=1 Tax=Methylorubrum rhodinum TaxID=29428 RepID=UPI003BAFF695
MTEGVIVEAAVPLDEAPDRSLTTSAMSAKWPTAQSESAAKAMEVDETGFIAVRPIA